MSWYAPGYFRLAYFDSATSIYETRVDNEVFTLLEKIAFQWIHKCKEMLPPMEREEEALNGYLIASVFKTLTFLLEMLNAWRLFTAYLESFGSLLVLVWESAYLLTFISLYEITLLCSSKWPKSFAYFLLWVLSPSERTIRISF